MLKITKLKKIFLIFFAAFLILIVSGLFVIKEFRERIIASNLLVHTYRVINKIQSTFSSFIETQKQLHFYIDTHSKKFLDLYQIGISEIQKQLVEIRQLTIDNASQQIKLNYLDKEIGKLTLLSHKILSNKKPLHLPSILIETEQWLANIKAIINEMIATEHSLINKRTKELEYQRSLNLISILLSTLLGYFFLVLSFLAIIKLAKKNEIKHLKLMQLKQEKLLQEESQRIELEFSLNSGNLGYWNLDLETQTAKRSLLHDQIFGYKTMLPNWTYKMFLSHVHPDDYHKVSQSFKKAVSKNLPWKVQCRIYRADDKSIRWIWAAGQIFKIGMHNHMLGVVQDITAIKNTELALQRVTIEVKSLLEGAPDALVISDQKGKITYINSMAEKLFGYTRSELMGQKIETLIPNRFGIQHEKHRQSYFKKPYVRPMGHGLELYAMHKNGLEIPVEINLSPIETDTGMAVIAAIRDITEHKQMQRLLAESEERWKFALESGNQGVWDWYVPEKIIYFSHTWKTMLGYQDDEIKNEQSEFESRVHPDDLPKVWRCIQDHFEKKTDEYICEVRFRCKNGSYKWVLDRGKVISRDPDGKVLRAIGTHTDIGHLKEQEIKLKQLAEHDPLTGLINRALFQDRLIQAISLANRHQDNIAILFLDLDEFKLINDTHGHAMGDLLLCAAAECIKNSIRDSDTLARLGGDEFAILLIEITNEKQVVNIVEKIMHHFSKGFLIKEKKFIATLSIGIALYPKNGKQLLIEKADAAMYYVKRHGKNNYKMYDNSIQMTK